MPGEPLLVGYPKGKYLLFPHGRLSPTLLQCWGALWPVAATKRAEADAFAALRARNQLVRAVRSLLKGSGLEIREREKELVISNPGHPEKGRIYITYATGEVTLRLTLWDYWGYLDGYGRALWADPDSEPSVEVDKIIGTLGGQVKNS